MKDISVFARPKRKRPVGSFTFLVMCQLNRLPESYCYGTFIERVLSDKYNEVIDIAQVFVTLERLVKKGYIKSKKIKSPLGRNQMVKVYTMTTVGRVAFNEACSFYKMVVSEIGG